MQQHAASDTSLPVMQAKRNMPKSLDRVDVGWNTANDDYWPTDQVTWYMCFSALLALPDYIYIVPIGTADYVYIVPIGIVAVGRGLMGLEGGHRGE